LKTYYDEKYNMHRSGTSNISRTNENKNSKENPDLKSSKCEGIQFYLDPHTVVYKKMI